MATSTYRVFLVEDEIVAREGIRDNVDWQACGFSFCGEAPDGEAALPLILQAKPDVVITDIRMPFMDGLQLCAIVRERLPQTRILVLSGYDEFAYAQQAIALGVCEYLLKPVSARDLGRALARMRVQLEAERAEEEERRQLALQLQDSHDLLRQELLMRLCLGDLDAFEALQRSSEIGIDLLAPAYTVVVARIECEGERDLRALQKAQASLLQAESLPRCLPFRKDIEELVYLLMAEDADAAQRLQAALAERLHVAIEHQPGLRLQVAAGNVQSRLSDLPLSFASALDQLALNAWTPNPPAPPGDSDPSERGTGPVLLDRQAIERFLKLGTMDDFDRFFGEYVANLEEQIAAVRHYRDYLLVDIAVAASTFVSNLGGPPAEIVPEAARITDLVPHVHAIEEMRELARRIIHRALDYRDAVAHQQHRHLILHARAYIETHYADADLGLQTVAAEVCVSPSHFSAVFSRETGETFKECLTRVRLDHAREMLRTTALPILEVGQRCGYNDPHYFSAVFKRVVGVSPREYREAGRPAAASEQEAS